MLILIIITIIFTPWFRSIPIPQDIINIDFKQDLKQIRSNVEWERGKIKYSPINVVFSNWPEEMFHQRIGIVMENLDFGNYFFAGHPRERVGVVEKQKFLPIQFILFLIGFTNKRLKKFKFFLIIYSAVILFLVFVFKWRSFEDTIFTSVPLVLLMSLGLESVLMLLEKLFKRFRKLANA